MEKNSEFNSVKKSDFTVKIQSVEGDIPVTYSVRCEFAMFKVKSDIYYKGNLIDSFECTCSNGRYKNRKPDGTGKWDGFAPESSEVETQLCQTLKQSLASGHTIHELFSDQVMDQYIDRILYTIYCAKIYDTPFSWVQCIFERLSCILCQEDGKYYLIVGPDKEWYDDVQDEPSILRIAHEDNEYYKSEGSELYFISSENWHIDDDDEDEDE